MANRWDRIALVSILTGVIVRIVWGLALHPPFDYLYSDMGGYVERAQRLATGAELLRFDAFFPPGTHMLLAAPMTLFGTERRGPCCGARSPPRPHSSRGGWRVCCSPRPPPPLPRCCALSGRCT